MNQNAVTLVNPFKLKPSKEVENLYSTPENYEVIKDNIRRVGILTPLHVIGNVVVSGNLRLRIAKELGLNLVPVLYQSESKISEKALIASYGQQRIKKYSEIIEEYELLKELYPVGKGKRTDLDPQLKSNSDKIKSLNIPKSKLYLLKAIKVLASELYGADSENYRKLWSNIDKGKTPLNRAINELKREKANRHNKLVIPEHYEFITGDSKVYNKSCENMNEIPDKSVACILTSPPYFKMRDYGTGKNQRGLERDIDAFIEGLLNDFKDCHRVLKDDGSLWVNLGEAVIDGQYNAIPHKFVIAMMNAGWIFNDEIIWVKNNPVFTLAKRSVRSHEYIFHFVKSKAYYYDNKWLDNLTDPNNKISAGTTGRVSKLLSSMDFRDSILQTNANNMEDLRKACIDRGFHLTHSAAFPITIPLIAILSTSKVGDTILDIYSGTGTTGEAAIATKRKYIGYEIKPEFVMASEVRIKEFMKEVEKTSFKSAA